MSHRDARYRFQVISPYIGMDVNSSDTHLGFGLPLSLPKFQRSFVEFSRSFQRRFKDLAKIFLQPFSIPLPDVKKPTGQDIT